MHCNGCNTSSYCDGVGEKLEPMLQVTIDRLEILKHSILRHDWSSAQFEFDRVLRSVTKVQQEVKS